MARPLKFTISKVNTGGKNLYRIFLPARFSKTGKKTALYYKSQAEAKNDQIKLQEKYLDGVIGVERDLTSQQLRDVNKAYDLMDENGVVLSIADAVAIAIEQRKARMQGIHVNEFLERYKEAVADARHWSKDQLSNWKFYSKKFEAKFGHLNIADVNQHELRDWMSSSFKSATYFNSALSVLGPAFTWAVKQELVSRSPFSFVERKRILQKDGIDVFSVEEAIRLLSCCRDFRSGKGHPLANGNDIVDHNYKLDCRDALIPFAFLLFAGIRPEELTKLAWDDVRLDDGFIHVTPSVAKTSQVRHVVIMDNLKRFIGSVPEDLKTGSIVPRNWKRKSYLVRKAAGLQGRHDTARHSFASYFLALDPNVDRLRENMGHVRNSDMLFKHYRAAVRKKDAVEFFNISLSGPLTKEGHFV